MENYGKFYQSFFSTTKRPMMSGSFDDYLMENKDDSKQERSAADFNILVFSREKDTRILLKTLFQLWGYYVGEANSIEDFWTKIESRQPKIIVIDSFLPFEASLEFITQIRRNEFCKKIPVVLLAGFPQSSHERLSLDAGAEIYFEKPIDFNSLENYLEGKSKELSIS